MNPEDSIRLGLQQAANGEVHDLGDFSQYAEMDEDREHDWSD
jgi:hypothetical protein